MKRGTPRNPKVLHLANLLKVKIPTAVGYLELLWHFTAEFTPQGDIGKYDDKWIEAALYWGGKEGRLIEALVQSRWLDRLATASPLPTHCPSIPSGESWCTTGMTMPMIRYARG